MKISTFAKSFAFAAVAALTLGIASTANAEDKGCTEATLKGAFVYTSTGSIVAAPPPIMGPYAEVGTQTFDGKGGVSFSFNASTNGSVGSGSGSGTYTVEEDCTGTFTETSEGFTSHFNFVIDDNWNGLQAICQDTGVVVTRIGRRQHPGFDRSHF